MSSIEDRMSSPHSLGYKREPPSPAPLSPPLSHTGPYTGAPGPSSLPPPLQRAGAEYAQSSVSTQPMVQFDPNATQSDDDEEDEDGGGRPKKKPRKAVPAGLVAAGGPVEGAADGGPGTGGEDDKDKGRRKIEIEYIHKKEKRHITFSKRKAGIMKKAYELATLTGTQVLLLVVSETGIVYTFTTAKFQPLVGAGPGGNPSEGQRLIQACLAVDPNDGSDYISPPPDGPLLPLPPSAAARPFETGSSIHGGQIALRTRAHRPGANHRSKPRPAAIRTQSGSAGAGALPTPVDHQSMLLSPSARQMQPDYSQGPSVLQGSPRGESLQSAQDYQNMMSRGYGNDPHPMPLSAGGRMESYGHQPGMDYGNNPPPPHSAHPQHHMHPSPDRFSSPLQHQQRHHQMEMQQAQAADGHYRQTSYEDRADYYPGYPPSHQHQAQEDYLAQHQAQQQRQR